MCRGAGVRYCVSLLWPDRLEFLKDRQMPELPRRRGPSGVELIYIVGRRGAYLEL